MLTLIAYRSALEAWACDVRNCSWVERWRRRRTTIDTTRWLYVSWRVFRVNQNVVDKVVAQCCLVRNELSSFCDTSTYNEGQRNINTSTRNEACFKGTFNTLLFLEVLNVTSTFLLFRPIRDDIIGLPRVTINQYSCSLIFYTCNKHL